MNDWINQCHFGDCRDTMRAMIAAGVKVQTIVTSPPYWGLRDYGVDGQIGLEESFPEFLDSLVEVFDLCRELLADDGTAWVNMGDSYSSVVTAVSSFRRDRAKVVPNGRKKSFGQLAPKNLIGQPFRLAFALQDAGWILRQDIVWHKPNPMPESVRDRCTKSHEYIFLLAKSDKYYFDQEAILEPVSPNTHARLSQKVAAQIGSERANGGAKTNGNMKAVARGVGWGHGTDADIRGRERVQRKGKEANPDPMARSASSMHEATLMPVTERNRRSVWTIPTQSYSGAHFATFPEALVEPCVLAGSRPGDIVFDPFFGSGTSGAVASRLGRRFVGCELNPAYESLQRDRLRQPGFAFEVVA